MSQVTKVSGQLCILKERSIFDILGRVMGRNSYDVMEWLKNLLAEPNFLDMLFGCLCRSATAGDSSAC